MTAPPARPAEDAEDAGSAVAAAFRAEWGQVVATLIRLTGDWDLAEECAQDAFAAALERWPAGGVPDRPGAWLTTAVRNRARDRLRRDAAGARKLRQAAALTTPPPAEGLDGPDGAGEFGDDRLRLTFTCCHPALRLDAQVALTLRTLAGLGTAEIARAFLVPEPTMSKRLTRAKNKIRDAGIPFRVPPPAELPGRTAAVLGVLYLLFNEGYGATGGDALQRRALCGEAIGLARLLTALMPAEAEARGLLALMLLHDARAAGRVDADGVLVTLERQDRARWDRAGIAEGVALPGGRPRARPAPAAARPLPGAGRHRRLPRHRPHRRRHRLGPDRRPVRAARAARAVGGRAAEPGGRRQVGPRARRRPGPGRRPGPHRRPGRLPPAARDPRRPAAPPGPPRRGRLPPRPGPGRQRRRPPLPDPPPPRPHRGRRARLKRA
ncbi:RNA polymerase sigma factor [Actinomadura sp. 9N215]|uniref:RNA polymerase sigma factor n=1 Tax=Actinomadura sp. 9N215 TaxID=3375150 RepID=UPI0037BCE063